MALTLKEQDAAHWVYRGEGAVNLVLAYTGSSPSFIGKVIRIRKAPRNGSQSKGASVRNSIALTPHERVLWKDVHQLISSSDKEIVGQLYVQHVMKPLLGSNYVDAGMYVLVTKEFLELVEKNVTGQRPAWRVDAARVDTHCDFGLLMSDHSLFVHGSQGSGHCLSVEIKPKCGFLPLSRFISEGNAIKRRITRFEMHQTLKLLQGEISQLSEYNPLDLFSGSNVRIQKAIRGLLTTPQNNFRVFLNGSLILGGLGGVSKDTDVCIAKAFEDELKSVIQADDGQCTDNLFTLVTEALQKSGVLDNLLEVQKLDNIDIEGAIHAYHDIVSQQCMVCRELNEEQAQIYTSLHSASLDEKLRIVKNYLIATTAKDCSLMLCFRPRNEGDSGSVYNNVYLESTKQAFDFKVYFIDLDLKRLSKVEDYYELDKKIVSCYRQTIKMDQEDMK
ncbi:inositol-pentakisphosphate 2-kinase [Cajanus cajan]|uniref:Inositol-pentakisphosphate 2-kinase n=1 Tax=Cajanus cajan TaxID=3821 RepID=A0A151RMF8_CAJCA|nr:inositol-pentakisphosphate 2-kinase [Cajanus cajan]KYP43693.1 Inositol-pentakisphosphate 2-kinase [Cajanus cajan]